MTPDLIVGRYRVVRAVGKGGMGTVWLCQDELLGREVAVKQVGMLPGESAPDTARALREARSAAALNHRNVVSVFDVVDDEHGRAWLVMEYVASRTLGRVLQEEGPLPPRRAAAVGAQVAEGLAAAHAVGTVHRDVKPGNILVGDEDLAKISDFGIARGATDGQLTSTGLVTGTPSYFSPELARGEDPGPEADVYALGATLYTVVEGRSPYPEQRNPIALLQLIAAEVPPPPQQAGPLAAPLARMMAREPADRCAMPEAARMLHDVAQRGEAPEGQTMVLPASFGTATAVAAPLAPEEPEPTAASSPAPPPAAAGTDRRSRRGVPWLVAAAVLLAAFGVGYLALGNDEQDPSAGPSEPTPSQTPAPSQEPTPGPEPEETEPEETEPAEEAPAEDSRDDARGTTPVQTVESYFAAVPGDLDTGWQMLGSSMKEQGRGAYEDWWSSIESVELHGTEPSGDEQVRIDLTYYFADGRATRETQLLTLEERGGDYLIADDEVLSSRMVS